MFGSGPAKVAESVNLANLEQCAASGQQLPPLCTVEEAKGYIEDYFRKFPRLKKWIDSCHDQIKQFGFIYSFFGRKRRLRNFRSTDRAVVGGEVRSGFNSQIQSASSDSLLLGVMAADNEILSKGLDIKIVGLVHDSVIAVVREDLVDIYNELIDRNVQTRRGNWDIENGCLAILGAPIGIDSDSEKGGSRDYGCGKLAKMFPFLAVLDDYEGTITTKCTEVIEKLKAGDTRDFDPKCEVTSAISKYRGEVLEVLADKEELICKK